MTKLGPYKVVNIETGTAGGHGPWGIVSLKRHDYEHCQLYITPEEAEDLRSIEREFLLTIEKVKK